MYNDFTFDGMTSEDLGIYIIGLDSNEMSYPIFGGNTITEQYAIENEEIYIVKLDRENLSFSLTFGIIEPEFDKDKECDPDDDDEDENREVDPATIAKNRALRSRLYSLGAGLFNRKPVHFTSPLEPGRYLYVYSTGQSEIIGSDATGYRLRVTLTATTPWWLPK